jgi:hypothetical protein
MDHFDYDNSSAVSHLNSIEGIQFDGRAYALYGIEMIDRYKFYFFSIF